MLAASASAAKECSRPKSEAGDISFIPMGCAHYIECVGEEECVMTVTFNHDKPQDVVSGKLTWTGISRRL